MTGQPLNIASTTTPPNGSEIAHIIEKHDPFNSNRILRAAITDFINHMHYDPTYAPSVFIIALRNLQEIAQRLPESDHLTDADLLKKMLDEFSKMIKLKRNVDALQDAFILLFESWVNKEDEAAYRISSSPEAAW